MYDNLQLNLVNSYKVNKTSITGSIILLALMLQVKIVRINDHSYLVLDCKPRREHRQSSSAKHFLSYNI